MPLDAYRYHSIAHHTNFSPVIDIHGGAFMLGHSRMVSLPQVNDCLERGWIVLVPNHRLCPGVNLLEGPMQDIRDLLSWVHDGHLDAVLKKHGAYHADLENVAVFGTSSGGTLALGLVSESRSTSSKMPLSDATLKHTNLITGLERPQACQGHSISLRRRALHRPPVDQAPPTCCSQTTPKSVRCLPQQDIRPEAHPDRQFSLFGRPDRIRCL